MWSTRFNRNAARIAALTAMVFGLVACGGGGGGSSTPPPAGVLEVNVTQAGSDPVINIEGARVAVIDGDTGEVVKVLITDSHGAASMSLAPGQVLLKVSAQGHAPSPHPSARPCPEPS